MQLDIESDVVDALQSNLSSILEEPCPNSTANWLNDYKAGCVDGKVCSAVEGKTKTGRKKVTYTNIPCPKCGGKGIVLTDTGRALLEVIRRWI